MGYFTKKSDPISDRARALNDEIAALQTQIQRLSAKQEKAARRRPPARSVSGNGTEKRFGRTRAKAVAPALDPVFEELQAKPLDRTVESGNLEPRDDLGLRREKAPGAIRRFFKQFQGRPPANPKLVNYLAAGSIQGLRPLRYEKRVARNRFVFLMVFLVLLLLGILTSFIRH